MNLNPSELATILHGLRLIQCEGRIEGCAAGDCPHFEDTDSLTNEQIDLLSERIVQECELRHATPPCRMRFVELPYTPQLYVRAYNCLSRKFTGKSVDKITIYDVLDLECPQFMKNFGLQTYLYLTQSFFEIGVTEEEIKASTFYVSASMDYRIAVDLLILKTVGIHE